MLRCMTSSSGSRCFRVPVSSPSIGHRPVAGRPRDESTRPACGFFARAFGAYFNSLRPSKGRRGTDGPRGDGDAGAARGEPRATRCDGPALRGCPRHSQGRCCWPCPRSCSVGCSVMPASIFGYPRGVLRPVQRNSTGFKTALNLLSFFLTPQPRQPSRTRPGPAPTPLPDADHPIADRPVRGNSTDCKTASNFLSFNHCARFLDRLYYHRGRRNIPAGGRRKYTGRENLIIRSVFKTRR
jgi:hypothetical protein